ncbi:hypothetical protein A2335_03610 [Candidatus Peregrinibacteria bacterium RIFOXYB2_FULL_32_7]|nr:MAG: hypothetical protein A2335_03610 [Candidatus Peregrinibacteria bacterium RIFOXYB2_FULL_32_7]
MKSILKFLLALILPYAHPFEKKVEKFLRKLKPDSFNDVVQKQLLELMQENLAILNLYLEWKSRQYKYLKKRKRRKRYEDLEKLKTDFLQNVDLSANYTQEIINELKIKNLSYPVNKEKELNYLWQIMKYLEPGKKFTYQESTSFGHLLQNPLEAKLIGDCNQIVTLYAYFYSLKFPLSDLKIKILPEHVCLHFEDLDIEATNGHFAKYTENEQILTITEIISTNLLDVSDQREKQEQISPKVMLKSAQLAYKISSNKDLVSKNLNIAYRNLAISEMNANNFEEAIYFVKQCNDRELLLKAYYNATVYYLNNKNFKKAHFYSRLHGDQELQTKVTLYEGHFYYEKNNLKDALQIFRKLGKHEMIKACLQKQYFDLYQKIKNVKTIKEAKSYKSIYQKLLSLGQEMQDQEKEKWVRDILGKI